MRAVTGDPPRSDVDVLLSEHVNAGQPNRDEIKGARRSLRWQQVEIVAQVGLDEHARRTSAFCSAVTFQFRA